MYECRLVYVVVLFGYQNVVSSLTNNFSLCSYLVAHEVICGVSPSDKC
jgi:hypothetical protein